MVCATSKASDQTAHMRRLIRAFASHLNILPTEHHFEFLRLKGGCTGSSESTLVKMPHCWKSHVAAHIRHPACVYFGCVSSSSGYFATTDGQPTVIGILLAQP